MFENIGRRRGVRHIEIGAEVRCSGRDAFDADTDRTSMAIDEEAVPLLPLPDAALVPSQSAHLTNLTNVSSVPNSAFSVSSLIASES